MERSLKKALGIPMKLSEKEIEKIIKSKVKAYCKPCWELKYCPYGDLVENFPLIPPLQKDALEHQEYLKECINNGVLGSGENLSAEKKRVFNKMIKEFRLADYPSSIPPYLNELSCKIFGHFCPVFFTAETFTETRHLRNSSRNIPRDILIKVIRRDNQVCQNCYQYVPESKIEIDHKIPLSKGGPTTVENLRVLCFDCNRKKSNSLKEIVDEDPLSKFMKKN
jgi:hypothetical protein